MKSWKLVLASLLFSTVAGAAMVGDDFAGEVAIVKPEPTMAVGDLYFSIDSKNKKRSIIQITSIEGKNVMGKVIKGEATPGERMEKRAKGLAVKKAPSREFASEDSEDPSGGMQTYQPVTRTGHAFGFGVGATYFSFKGTGAEGVSGTLGYSVMGTYGFKYGRFTLATGAQYYQAGAKQDLGGAVIEYKLNYLGVPVLAMFDLAGPDSSSAVNLKAGFIYSQLMSASARVTINNATSDVTLAADEKTDYLAIGGIQWVSREKMGQYWIDLSYLYGLKSFKNASGQAITNNGTVLSIGLDF